MSGTGEEILNPPIETVQLTAAGRLRATVIIRSEITDGAGALAGTGILGLIARRAPRDQDEVVADAVAAEDADIAVVLVGLTDEQETEAVDKQRRTACSQRILRPTSRPTPRANMTACGSQPQQTLAGNSPGN